jgi:hypothetical protein
MSAELAKVFVIRVGAGGFGKYRDVFVRADGGSFAAAISTM